VIFSFSKYLRIIPSKQSTTRPLSYHRYSRMKCPRPDQDCRQCCTDLLLVATGRLIPAGSTSNLHQPKPKPHMPFRSGPPLQVERTERIRTTTYVAFLDYCTDSTYSTVFPQQNVTSQQLITNSQHLFFRIVHCHRYSRISLRTIASQLLHALMLMRHH
jgi:hypothetical protein